MTRAVRKLTGRFLDQDVQHLVVVELEHLGREAYADRVGLAFVAVDDNTEVTHGTK